MRMRGWGVENCRQCDQQCQSQAQDFPRSLLKVGTHDLWAHLSFFKCMSWMDISTFGWLSLCSGRTSSLKKHVQGWGVSRKAPQVYHSWALELPSLPFILLGSGSCLYVLGGSRCFLSSLTLGLHAQQSSISCLDYFLHLISFLISLERECNFFPGLTFLSTFKCLQLFPLPPSRVHLFACSSDQLACFFSLCHPP